MPNATRIKKSSVTVAVAAAAPEFEGRLLLVEEAAERSQLSVAYWRREIARGALPVVRLGRAVRIDEADFVAHLAARRSQGRRK